VTGAKIPEANTEKALSARPMRLVLHLHKSTDSYTPPLAVQAAARRALQVRKDKPPSERGGTSVGLATARLLASGRPVSLAKVRHIAAYFPRHEPDKQGETWDEQGKGWQAWHLWGGDAGWRWARAIVERADKATEKALRPREKLRGGTADGRCPEDFDPEALAEGIAHEREHTDDEAIAREIAMDHLAEDPSYYKKLKRIERSAA